ncbi:MAG: hypothetical protein WAK48_15550 [Candidatus Acidiferrum sp.]
MDRLSFLSKLIDGLQWGFARVAISPDFHQRRIDGNARQPRCELRPPVEIPQMHQSAQEALLERVFRVLTVSGNPKRHLENFFLMALAKFSEGS